MNILLGISGRLTYLASRVRAVVLLKLQRCKAGRGCSIAIGTRLRATDGAKINFGNNVTIDRFADLNVKYGMLQIGPRSYIGQFSVICAREKIRIGADCLIAEHVTIRDQDHRVELGKITSESGFITSPIVIGNNVWIGAKATITKGVQIGDNSVIGANSVVSRDIPENTIVAGAPARVIRKIG